MLTQCCSFEDIFVPEQCLVFCPAISEIKQCLVLLCLFCSECGVLCFTILDLSFRVLPFQICRSVFYHSRLSVPYSGYIVLCSIYSHSGIPCFTPTHQAAWHSRKLSWVGFLPWRYMCVKMILSQKFWLVFLPSHPFCFAS